MAVGDVELWMGLSERGIPLFFVLVCMYAWEQRKWCMSAMISPSRVEEAESDAMYMLWYTRLMLLFIPPQSAITRKMGYSSPVSSGM